MVYIEKEACPEKNDFLGGEETDDNTMVMQAATEASGGRTHRASWTLLSGP